MSYLELICADMVWGHTWARGVGMPIGSDPSIFEGEFNGDLHQGVWYHIYCNLQAKVHGYDLLS
jgi:hypothetical protein